MYSFGNLVFFVSCVYENPNQQFRHLVWERLSRTGIQRKKSWCMLYNGEKIGGPRRIWNSFLPFANMLEAYGMAELPSVRNGFTWVGKRYKLWIQCKLDRCFSNKAWMNLFPAANQAFLKIRGSDHRLVVVNPHSSQDSYMDSFRFNKRMLYQPLVKEVVLNAWNINMVHCGNSVSGRLRRCRKALSKWKKENNANSKERINLIQQQLENEYTASSPSYPRISWLKCEMVQAYREEESFWQQKSRDKWVKLGDKNTRFFHASVKGSRARNEVDKLMDILGNLQSSEASKGEVAVQYFSNLFTS